MIAVVRPDHSTARQFAPDTWLVCDRAGRCHIEAPGLPPIHVAAERVIEAEMSLHSFVDATVHQEHRRRLLDEVTDERFAAALAVALNGVAA